VSIDGQAPNDEIAHMLAIEGLDDVDKMRGLHAAGMVEIGEGQTDETKLSFG